MAYAYILGRDGGAPMVFDDGSGWKSDGGRWAGAWTRDWLRKMIQFHNAMQGKWMEVLHADDCTLLWRRDQDGVVALNKCAETKTVTVDTRGKFRWNRPYRERLGDGSSLTISGETFTFSLPGRQARMWMVE